MIALALSLVLATQDSQYPDDQFTLAPPWSHVEVGDWTVGIISADGNVLSLTRPARQGGHLWHRFEFKEPENGILSTRILQELDCEGWRTRVVQIVRFSTSNLRGAGTNGLPSTWEAAAPDTYADSALKMVCGN
jgi:hypothetical protein